VYFRGRLFQQADALVHGAMNTFEATKQRTCPAQVKEYQCEPLR
jgi:hypothetical protein